ncbi:MAG: hypothetical protein PHH54_02900 [Candidatus Nanoarchaeia archaeon]|nr:hypothetical protein [Candidatus Nanoarchaeia archaeon]MDD5740908.1 hypothetical protein [Candidatus Nanoarchaeia archaeon]
MENKKGFEMSFNWIFAIIVGAIILFIAIYATTRVINTGEYQINTETAAKIETLLDPARPGLASLKSEQVDFAKDMRTYFTCNSIGTFGKQALAFSEKIFGKWGEKGGEISSMKYIFAENVIEGKNLYLFSMPFKMPFKIDDLIMISGKKYCFYQTPNDIKDKIKNLNLKNIYFAENSDDKNCTGINVCFENECNISVYGLCEGFSCDSPYDYGKVSNQDKDLYYYDNLLYAAIFSSPEIYECNAERLMKKFSELAGVYIEKANLLELKNCGSNPELDLVSMQDTAKDKTMEISNKINSLSKTAKSIDMQNQIAVCKLY